MLLFALSPLICPLLFAGLLVTTSSLPPYPPSSACSPSLVHDAELGGCGGGELVVIKSPLNNKGQMRGLNINCSMSRREVYSYSTFQARKPLVNHIPCVITYGCMPFLHDSPISLHLFAPGAPLHCQIPNDALHVRIGCINSGMISSSHCTWGEPSTYVYYCAINRLSFNTAGVGVCRRHFMCKHEPYP